MRFVDIPIAGKFCRNGPGIHALLVVLCGFLAYSNTFHVPFVLDDQYSIIDNPVVHDLSTFLDGSGYRYNTRRFVGYLTVALNYRLGGLDVTGYHIFNLVVHVGAALLVYALCRLIFQTPRLRGGALTPFGPWIALASGLLFVAHPVQTQAVTYIIQRLASLAAFFYLASLVFYLQARLRLEAPDSRADVREVQGGGSRWRAMPWFVGSLAAALLAMKTKETAFTLPFMIGLCEFTFFKAALRRRLLFMLPVPVLALVVPLSLMQAGKPPAEIWGVIARATRETTDISRLDYLFTQFRVLVTYIRLLLWPADQNLDYDYPIYTSFFTPPVFLSFLLLAALFALALYLFFSKRPAFQASRLTAFGIFWFFLALSVESSIIPITDVIFEHRLYLPVAGAAMACSTAIAHIFSKRSAIARNALLGTLVLILAVATWKRNEVWQGNLSLWQDVVEKSPGKARPHEYLGYTLLKEAGDVDGAIRELEMALKLDPKDPTARHSLGLAYMKKGWTEPAIEQFLQAVALDPKAVESHFNLAVALGEMGRVEDSIRHYLRVLALESNRARAHYNIGVKYGEKGDMEKAIGHFQRAASIEPDFVNAVYNLGIAYELTGKPEKAIDNFRKALQLQPDLANAHFHLGNNYRMLGFTEKAMEHYQVAAKMRPEDRVILDKLR